MDSKVRLTGPHGTAEVVQVSNVANEVVLDLTFETCKLKEATFDRG
jgi:hypothetical protein